MRVPLGSVRRDPGFPPVPDPGSWLPDRRYFRPRLPAEPRDRSPARRSGVRTSGLRDERHRSQLRLRIVHLLGRTPSRSALLRRPHGRRPQVPGPGIGSVGNRIRGVSAVGALAARGGSARRAPGTRNRSSLPASPVGGHFVASRVPGDSRRAGGIAGARPGASGSGPLSAG